MNLLKQLIIWTATFTLLTFAIQWILLQFGFFFGPFELFSLSWVGIESGYLWQLITYVLIQKTSYEVNFFYLVALALDYYLIWAIGSRLISRIGTSSFFFVYFFSAVLAGISALLAMLLLNQNSFIAGNLPPLLAILVVWTMTDAEEEFLLFSLLPIQLRWVTLTFVGIALLFSLIEMNLPHFAMYFSSLLFAYLYSTMRWKLQTPYPFLHKMDVYFANLGGYLAIFLEKHFPSLVRRKVESKIVDFSTGKTISRNANQNDDDFIDAMLAKISREGEKALTRSERKRMQQISEKKQREKLENSK